MSIQHAPWVQRQLLTLLAAPGHAWLLQGPAGLGQYSLALALAQAWLCENPAAQGACGHCVSCHAVEVRTHADLRVLMPETTMLELGWPLSEEAQQELDEKKRKPSQEIRIQAMREAVEFSQLTSARGRGKVVLVYPAQAMNHVTANAMLKTLEEPAGDVRFVLAVEGAGLVLPTIRSRCLVHSMIWPAPSEAAAWLEEQGMASRDAPVVLQAAGGRPGQALEFAGSGRDAQAWAALPRAMARGDFAGVSQWAPAQVLDALQKLCHDMLLLACGAPPRFFRRTDLPEPPPPARLGEWARNLGQAARSIDHPFNTGLLIESLVAQARAALNSQHE